jgi:sugar/nucleoside kinase (ribokinase family)
MHALFIGQTYIDVTFITDHMPTGDEKHVASAYAVSFGGNAVTAAFACAKLGIVPDLIATVANDWLGRMFQDMSAKYGISIHPRKVNTSSLSFIMPKDGKRAIVRCRDDEHIHPFPLPGPARRRSPARRRDPLCETVPRGGHPDVARRRRLARQYP